MVYRTNQKREQQKQERIFYQNSNLRGAIDHYKISLDRRDHYRISLDRRDHYKISLDRWDHYKISLDRRAIDHCDICSWNNIDWLLDLE